MKTLLRYWHTLRYLRPIQFYGRIWFWLYRPRPKLGPTPKVRPVLGKWVRPARREPSLIGPETFIFLAKTGELNEIGWNGPQHEKLWRYNQHYFDDLNAQDSEARANWHRALMLDWVFHNPPGKGDGWEPYPTSLRIVNWVKWALSGHALPPECLNSLAVQARWLTERLEIHLLGNHLFANAKALVFAGLFFEGEEACKWLQKGIHLISRELAEQILVDGGHYERSPMYHLIILEDILDMINIFRAYRKEIPNAWFRAAELMLGWSYKMRHPDGEIPFFNDAAFGVSPPPNELDRYASNLKISPKFSSLNNMLLGSGYGRAEVDRTVVFLDCAPVGPDYQPGHAHADTLSFEISWGGRRVFVNSGTSIYGRGDQRQWQRSSPAHNALIVDGEDSSEVWGGFRVARRARVFGVRTTLSANEIHVSAKHDGYRRLSGKIIHERAWRITANTVEISDFLDGHGRHRIELFFHLHPDVHVKYEDGVLHLIWSNEGREFGIFRADPALKVHINPGRYFPRFGQYVPNKRIVCWMNTQIPCRISNHIVWKH